jgi:cysteine-rich repeat protein
VNTAAGEECDASGATADCDSDCTYVVCGDGILHTAAGEQCDEGVETANCDADCSAPGCGDGITNVADGEQCDDFNNANSDGCSAQCQFEATGGAGDRCESAIALTLGSNSVSWTGTTNDYLAWHPPCSQGEPKGADVVLSYTATFTGTLELNFTKPDSNEWVAVVNRGVCGDTSAPVACMARVVGTSLFGSFPVVTGSTYYVYVSDTSFGGLALSNPFTVTLTASPATTGENCSTAIPISLGKNSVNWSATEQDAIWQTPSCTEGAAVEPPDIALLYTAGFDGYLKFDIAKPDASRWVAVVKESCASSEATLGCLSNLSGTSLKGLVGVTGSASASSGARDRYFLIADTRIGTGTLSNPLTITLTGIDQAGGTGETCDYSGRMITLGTNTVGFNASVNNHLTATPSCTAGHAVTGPDAVFEYKAPKTGTLTVTINKPAATRWVAVVSGYTCGDVSPGLACISDYANTKMSGSLQVVAGARYYLYVAATAQGTIPLVGPTYSPLTITLSQ